MVFGVVKWEKSGNENSFLEWENDAFKMYLKSFDIFVDLERLNSPVKFKHSWRLLKLMEIEESSGVGLN